MTEKPEETAPDETASWTRMENLVDAAVKKGLQGWSPEGNNSSPASTPEVTPATPSTTPEPTPTTQKKVERKRGFLSDFFQGLGD